ncbi:tetratricopeptide (TPR) repeat protein [Salinibacter ruber]|uniref:Tetratricopeptide repeat domain protein n=2 Tax=Salinibacter ruber TaxID=146919 RepID=Q2S4J1_SALRD|nr:tetratricopeptide repeat domain protein [Salinibacter ruber DSM 13855]MBB4061982.1 tetratricopeptide (TPR) repeat protein [Salinibacter ruber]MCS3670441.1 tetratricopeptide (TPR) repeat protein [Salinibacter ruber]MCS3936734.1 tetratricopeptide (TPR) repeat protein [Salinibacter ruber]MCS4044194.1 tetratricopeptide (TPR) repeat protein [Salinibacter ruber]
MLFPLILQRPMLSTPTLPRKTFAFLLGGVLLVGLVACGSSTPMAPASSASSALESAAADSLLRQVKTQIREATDEGSLDSLKQARAWAKQATGGDRAALAHYYAALADYRMSNRLPEEDEARRGRVIEDAIGHLKRATEINGTMADAWALLSGYYGQMMGMNPMQGMSLGPKANEAMKRAKEHGPNNPRVWIIDGTSDFYTPGMFGGDKEKALTKFEKAARLAEQGSPDDPLMPGWGHAEAHAWVGVAHMEAERYDPARTAFEAALDLNPDYGWVRSVLLPRLEQQAG